MKATLTKSAVILAAGGAILAGTSVATAAPAPTAIYKTYSIQPNWGSPQINGTAPLRYGTYLYGLTHILDRHTSDGIYSGYVEGCIVSVLDRFDNITQNYNFDGTQGTSVVLRLDYSGTWANVAIAQNKAADGKIVGIITAYPHTDGDWKRCAAVDGAWAARGRTN